MEITDKHVEWAVVHRLRQMLEAPRHQEFNVTQTYALFTTILCWTIQRIRTDKDGPMDRLAQVVRRQLEQQIIRNEPWLIQVQLPENSQDVTAYDFMIALRNASAHGDGRNVRPYHLPRGAKRELVGFTFGDDESKGSGKSKTLKITLLEGDLRRIGIGLADMFCTALQHGNEDISHDAEAGVIEKKAA
jgi:hypothetical protein